MKIENQAMLKQLLWATYVKCYNHISSERDKLQDVIDNHEDYVICNCALIEMDIQNYYYYKALLSAISDLDAIHVVTGKRSLLGSMEREFIIRRTLFQESIGFAPPPLIYPLSFAEVFKNSHSDFAKGSTPLDYCNLVMKKLNTQKV